MGMDKGVLCDFFSIGGVVEQIVCKVENVFVIMLYDFDKGGVVIVVEMLDQCYVVGCFVG